MTKCDTCKKDVKVTKCLTLLRCPQLCEECFNYVILDELNHETYIDLDYEVLE